MFLHSRCHAGCVDLFNQPAKPTFTWWNLWRARRWLIQCFKKVMEGNQLPVQAFLSASMGLQTLGIHQAINICCVDARLYVQMLYIACRNCFCTLVNVNLLLEIVLYILIASGRLLYLTALAVYYPVCTQHLPSHVVLFPDPMHIIESCTNISVQIPS